MILAAIVLFCLAAALGLWLVVLGVRYRRGSRALAAGHAGHDFGLRCGQEPGNGIVPTLARNCLNPVPLVVGLTMVKVHVFYSQWLHTHT